MQLTIVKFDTHKAALTLGLIMALSSLVFLVPFGLLALLGSAATPENVQTSQVSRAGISMMMMIIMPLFYFVFGYLMTRFGAWLYNKVSGATGGFVLTVEIDNQSSVNEEI